jgi:hypothetical protein
MIIYILVIFTDTITSFADRDSLMRFHYGLGVGHVYSHTVGVLANLSDAYPAIQTGDERVEGGRSILEDAGWRHTGDGEADEEDEDHDGVEELIPFEQGRNGSSETLIDALDEMYIGHTLDYEN